MAITQIGKKYAAQRVIYVVVFEKCSRVLDEVPYLCRYFVIPRLCTFPTSPYCQDGCHCTRSPEASTLLYADNIMLACEHKGKLERQVQAVRDCLQILVLNRNAYKVEYR